MRHLLRWLQPTLAVLAILFIGAFVAQQWPALRAHAWRLHGGWLAAAALLMLASWALEVRIWTGLLHALGARLPYVAAVRIWFLTAVVRYIPGTIWQPLSMTLHAHQRGVLPGVTVASVILYQLVTLLAVGPLAAGYFWWSGNWGLLFGEGGPGVATAPLLIALVLPLLLFVLLPGPVVALLNRMLARAGRPPLEAHPDRARLALLLAAAAVDWLLWGATFAALTAGLSALPGDELRRMLPHLLLAWPVAYAVGVASFLLPSGLGVREGALYLLLAPVLGGAIVTVAALAMRLWIVAGEVIMALLAAASARLERPAQTPAPVPVPAQAQAQAQAQEEGP